MFFSSTLSEVYVTIPAKCMIWKALRFLSGRLSRLLVISCWNIFSRKEASLPVAEAEKARHTLQSCKVASCGLMSNLEKGGVAALWHDALLVEDRLHLGYISATSRLHLGYISAASRLHLGNISLPFGTTHSSLSTERIPAGEPSIRSGHSWGTADSWLMPSRCLADA